MQIRKGKKLIISKSNDGVIVIADVQANKTLEKGEYEISADCAKRNVKCGTFVDISNRVDYDGRIYALAQEL